MMNHHAILRLRLLLLLLVTTSSSLLGQTSVSEPYKSLYEAAQKGDLKAVKKLYKTYSVEYDRDWKQDGDQSPLDVAIRNNHLPVVEYLLEMGLPSNNPKGDPSKSSFLYALQKGYLDIFKLLLKSNDAVEGPWSDQYDRAGQIAIKEKQYDIMTLLVTGYTDQGDIIDTTLSYRAYLTKDKRALQAVAEAEGAINDQNKDGFTVLDYALMDGNKDMATYIKELVGVSGIELTDDGHAAGLIALKTHNKTWLEDQEVRELKPTKTCSEVPTENCCPLLYTVALIGDLEMMELLLKKEADVNEMCNGTDDMPINAAICSSNHKAYKLLKSKGANLDPHDDLGNEKSIKKALYCNSDSLMLSMLINDAKGKADFSAMLEGSVTLLDIAIMRLNRSAVRLLLEAGADVNNGMLTEDFQLGNDYFKSPLRHLREAMPYSNPTDQNNALAIEKLLFKKGGVVK